MTPLLIRHHLLAGWRNILKYKTQNLISILCLSVGTVLFAVVLWIVIGHWNRDIEQFDKSLVPVSMFDLPEDFDPHAEYFSADPCYFNHEDVTKIRHLSIVKDVFYINSMQNCPSIELYNTKGHQVSHYLRLFSVSPTWFQKHHLRSATTGKEFGELKNGTILLADCSIDEDQLEGDSPFDLTAKNMVPFTHIDDIINTCNYWGGLKGIYIVNDGTLDIDIYDKHEDKYLKLDLHCFNDFYVILQDGATEDQLHKELKKLFPQHEFSVAIADEYNSLDHYWLLIAILILSLSVLIVGLTGYLKMQMQLFGLRAHEMALRRCNGAKTVHLFLLLVAELMIVFLIVTGCAMLLTMMIANYAVPRLELLYPEFVDFKPNYPFFFRIESWITFISFILSIIIAWFAARKVVHQPLGKTVGKSYSPKTFMHSTMQVVQFFTATLVIFFIGLVMLKVKDTTDQYNLSRDPDFYKNVIYPGFDSDGFDHLVNAEILGRAHSHTFIVSHRPQDLPTLSRDAAEDFKDNQIGVQVVDTAMFRLMGIQVSTDEEAYRQCKKINKKTYHRNGLYPVYVEKSYAKQIREQMGIKDVLKNKSPMLISEHEMIRIGYAPMLDDVKIDQEICGVSIYIIHPHSDFYDNPWRMKDFEYVRSEYGGEQVSGTIIPSIILPKKGKYSDMMNELYVLLDKEGEATPGDKSWIQNLKDDITPAYDSWFKDLISINLLRQLSLILAIVCIASIVLSVYSSISLETRGRQKEVAIRKVHGAKTHDIVKLFFRYYLIILPIAFVLAGVVGIAGVFSIPQSDFFGSVLPEGDNTHVLLKLILVFLLTALVIALVTFLTIWHKVYKVAHTNAAEMIKKE